MAFSWNFFASGRRAGSWRRARAAANWSGSAKLGLGVTVPEWERAGDGGWQPQGWLGGGWLTWKTVLGGVTRPKTIPFNWAWEGEEMEGRVALGPQPGEHQEI